LYLPVFTRPSSASPVKEDAGLRMLSDRAVAQGTGFLKAKVLEVYPIV